MIVRIPLRTTRALEGCEERTAGSQHPMAPHKADQGLLLVTHEAVDEVVETDEAIIETPTAQCLVRRRRTGTGLDFEETEIPQPAIPYVIWPRMVDIIRYSGPNPGRSLGGRFRRPKLDNRTHTHMASVVTTTPYRAARKEDCLFLQTRNRGQPSIATLQCRNTDC